MKKSTVIFLVLFLFQITFVSAQCFSTNLEEGDMGVEVNNVQHFLKKELSLDFETTNYFGPITKQAVISFQEKYRDEILTPLSLPTGTGYWGLSTYTKANTLCEDSTTDNTHVLTPQTPPSSIFTGEEILFGQTSDQIKIVQEILNKEVDANLPITGYFGPMTLNAINLFQEKYRDEILVPNGFNSPTGYFGPATRFKMLQLSIKSQTPASVVQPVRKYVIKKNGPRSSNDKEEEVITPINAPVNTSLPVISGDIFVGETLSTTDGIWSGDPLTYSYQWFRDDAEIGNATSSTYDLTYLDFEKQISVEVTAVNEGGGSTALTSSTEDITYSFLPISNIAFVGDSITTAIGSGGIYWAHSYASQARAQSGSLFDFLPDPDSDNLHFAISGTRTGTHLATLLPNALVAGAKMIVYHGGTNDATDNAPLEDVLLNIEAMINLVIDEGSMIVLTPVLGPPSLAGNTTKNTYVVNLNAGIEALAEEYNMPFVDWRPLTEESPGVTAVGITYDNTHPGQYGSWQMGSILAEGLMPYLNTDYLDDFWTEIESGEYGELLASNNYTFENITGSTPTGYAVNTVSWSGDTLVQSVIPRSDGDGNGNWWQIQANNAVPGTGQFYITNPINRRHQDTAQTGDVSSITLGTSATASADFYKNHRIWIIGGTGSGQTRYITGYTSARVATVDVPWITVPDTTSQVIIGLRDGERVQLFAEIEIEEGTDLRGLGGNNRTTATAPGSVSGDLYTGGASQTIEAYSFINPVRKIILRGPISNASNFSAANNFDQMKIHFGGSGTIRFGRTGVIGLDRQPGQLTFTP